MKPRDPLKITAIKNATVILVAKEGLSAFQMSALSKHTQLGMGTIYGYFPGKEELINETFKHLKQQHTPKIYKGIDVNGIFKEEFDQLCRNYINHRRKHHAEHVFIEQCQRSHFLDAESRAYDAAAYTLLFKLLDKGKREHLVKNLPNALLASQMIGAANGIIDMAASGAFRLTTDMINQMIQMSWDAVTL